MKKCNQIHGYFDRVCKGVENLEETVMPLTLINVSNYIEDEGFEAIPQRKNPLILNEEGTTNPEVDYTDVYHGVKAENQLDNYANALHEKNEVLDKSQDDDALDENIL